MKKYLAAASAAILLLTGCGTNKNDVAASAAASADSFVIEYSPSPSAFPSALPSASAESTSETAPEITSLPSASAEAGETADDETPEEETAVYDLRNLPNYTFVSQVKPSLVWMGCESAALLMALKTTGHAQDITYTEFLDALPKTDSDNPYLGFCGSLYSNTWMRDAVMPNIITEWGSWYGNTRDLTKQGLEPVLDAIRNNHPVVVWVSSHMVPSETVWDDTQTGLTDDAVDPLTGETLNYHGSTGSHWEYKTHNHVMTLLGYNEQTQEFLLGDPAEWQGETYWVSYDTFMNSWNCYQGAVEVW